MSVDWIQLGSLVGAVLVLAAYGGQQLAGLRAEDLAYGVLNLVGSLLLAGSAIAPLNPGVLLLESTWALFSAGIVYRALVPRSSRPEGPPPLDGPSTPAPPPVHSAKSRPSNLD